jgi:septum formation topological specificity factor MinE
LTPVELEKLKTKIKTEISTAEIRIQYLLNKTNRPKERDPKEIENLENDIKNLKAKYSELIDPTVTIYKIKKRAVEKETKQPHKALTSPINLTPPRRSHVQ